MGLAGFGYEKQTRAVHVWSRPPLARRRCLSTWLTTTMSSTTFRTQIQMYSQALCNLR